MSINGVGNGPPIPVNQGQQRKAEQAQVGGQIKPAKPEKTEVGETGRAKGVVRLLQQGQFKGVADVRLRINFADELNAISQSSLQTAVSGDVSAVIAAVDTQVNELLTSDDFDEAFSQAVRGAQETFDSAVNDLVSAFGEDPDAATTDLLDGIQAAFNDFVSALTEIFTPDDTGTVEVAGAEGAGGGSEVPAIPAPAGETVPVAAPPPPATSLSTEFQAFLDKLTTAFDSAIESFGNSLTQAAEVLPPLSEPNGNGAAYEKFLSILNGLGGGTEDPPTTTTTDLDTAV